MLPCILVIGGGNMGGAMALRWHRAGYDVTVIEPDEARRNNLATQGLTCHTALEDAPQADIAILAIKPQQFIEAQTALCRALAHDPLLVSILAGTPLMGLHTICTRAVRAMPNLPALIGESMSVLCAPSLAADTRAKVTELFTAIGQVAWVEAENDLHAVTAISGSGPAYVFAFMEALEAAAIQQGLPRDLARQLVMQTLRGAALLADMSDKDAATLRRDVTSKGGTTEAALTALTQGEFAALVARAAAAAAERSKALAQS